MQTIYMGQSVLEKRCKVPHTSKGAPFASSQWEEPAEFQELLHCLQWTGQLER